GPVANSCDARYDRLWNNCPSYAGDEGVVRVIQPKILDIYFQRSAFAEGLITVTEPLSVRNVTTCLWLHALPEFGEERLPSRDTI
ncbi:MAG: hypothetical protein JSW07_22720, partial [bacterium]